MNTKDFLRLGVPLGEATRLATNFVAQFILGGGDKSRLHEEVAAVVANPSAFTDDPLRGEFAKALLKAPPPPRTEPVKYRQWGEHLEHDAVTRNDCRAGSSGSCIVLLAAAVQMPDGRTVLGQPENCLKQVASQTPLKQVGRGLALTRLDGRNDVDYSYRSPDSGGWQRGIL
jgi:hypothetical protein